MCVLFVLLLHVVFSFTQQTKIGEGRTAFTADFFPHFHNYRAINSSAIAIDWYPSSEIANISLDQLYGTMNISAYAGYQLYTYSKILAYPLTKLDENGTIVITGLQQNTIYSVRVYPGWRHGNDIILQNGLLTNLVRTYTTSKQS